MLYHVLRDIGPAFFVQKGDHHVRTDSNHTIFIYELIGIQRVTPNITLILGMRRTKVQLETGYKSKRSALMASTEL